MLITAFRAGATPEEIVQQFTAVSLADAYRLIAHYLSHTDEIDAYMAKRQVEALKLQTEIEALYPMDGLRARLLARQKATHSY